MILSFKDREGKRQWRETWLFHPSIAKLSQGCLGVDPSQRWLLTNATWPRFHRWRAPLPHAFAVELFRLASCL